MSLRPLVPALVLGLGLALPAVAGEPAQRARAGREPASGRFEEIMGAAMACRGTVRPGEAIRALRAEGLIEGRPYMVLDSLNFFALREPLTLGGLAVVAVHGFDEEAPTGFRRGPGTSPGNVIGFVTTAPPAAVERWRGRANPRLGAERYVNDAGIGPNPPRATQVRCVFGTGG